jgi:hypothetical protein
VQVKVTGWRLLEEVPDAEVEASRQSSFLLLEAKRSAPRLVVTGCWEEEGVDECPAVGVMATLLQKLPRYWLLVAVECRVLMLLLLADCSCWKGQV